MPVTQSQIDQATKKYLEQGNTITKLPVSSRNLGDRCPWCQHLIPLTAYTASVVIQAMGSRTFRRLCTVCAPKYRQAINTSEMIYLRKVNPKKYHQRRRLLFDQGIQGEQV